MFQFCLTLRRAVQMAVGGPRPVVCCSPRVIALVNFLLGILSSWVVQQFCLLLSVQHQEMNHGQWMNQQQEMIPELESPTLLFQVDLEQDCDDCAVNASTTSVMNTAVAKYDPHLLAKTMDGAHGHSIQGSGSSLVALVAIVSLLFVLGLIGDWNRDREGIPLNDPEVIEVEDDSGISELDRRLLREAQSGRWQRIMSLLRRGASTEAVGIYYNTPLMLASIYGHLETVQVLMDNGAAINARNNSNSSPLVLAAMNGHTLIAQNLLQAGADITIRGCRGMTAIEWAQENGFYDIYEMLRDAERLRAGQQGVLRWWHLFA